MAILRNFELENSVMDDAPRRQNCERVVSSQRSAISLMSGAPDPRSLDSLYSALGAKSSDETITYPFLHCSPAPPAENMVQSLASCFIFARGFHPPTPFPSTTRCLCGATSLCFSGNLWIGLALISISRVPPRKTFMFSASRIEQFCLNIYKLPSTPGRNPLPPAPLPQFFGGVFSFPVLLILMPRRLNTFSSLSQNPPPAIVISQKCPIHQTQ